MLLLLMNTLTHRTIRLVALLVMVILACLGAVLVTGGTVPDVIYVADTAASKLVLPYIRF